MDDDRDVVKRALELQAQGRDYPLNQLPGYMEWSERKLEEGENDALIAHLDATCMWLTAEDAAKVTEADFEELLADLRASLAKPQRRP